MPLHPILAPLSFAVAVFFGLYMAYEIWRWFAGNRGELTRGQLARRLVGGALLETALLMWVLAQPLMANRTAPEKLLYLLWSMLFAVLAMLFAVREAAFVVRQYAAARRELAGNLGRRDE